MAPELFDEGALNGMPADIFSLGLTLFDMFAAALGSSITRPTLRQMVVDQKKVSIPPSFDPELRQLLQGMLQLDPTLRPTAQQVLAHGYFVGATELDEFRRLAVRQEHMIQQRLAGLAAQLLNQMEEHLDDQAEG